MDISYRRDKDHNYMVLDAPGNITGDEYQVRMIIGNQIPHILKCNKRMMDGKAFFFYEITGMQPMFRKYEKTLLSLEDISELLHDIKKTLENADRYLLDENQILFEPEYLFFDVQKRQWNFCYLPSYQGNIANSFRVLSEYILKKLDHSDEQAVRLGYEIYSKASEENYRISEVLQLAYQTSKKEEQPETVMKEASEESFVEEDILEERPQQGTAAAKKKESKIIEQKNAPPFSKEYGDDYEYAEESKASLRKEKLAGTKLAKVRSRSKKTEAARSVNLKKAIFILLFLFTAAVMIGFLLWQGVINQVQAGGILFLAVGAGAYMATLKKEELPEGFLKKKQEFDDFSEDMGTSVLQEGENIQMAMLVSLRPEENTNILLYKDETRIGKEGRHADVCISQDVISRVHARIQKEEGEYYVTDLDSTNGTYVNGRRISGLDKVKLQQGDRVAFANVEYIFQMS